MISLLLAIVGTAEAVVYQARYRATHGTPIEAAGWTFAVCVLRVAFVSLGVSAALANQWAVAVLAYAVPAAVVTSAVRLVELVQADKENA